MSTVSWNDGTELVDAWGCGRIPDDEGDDEVEPVLV
jgi:hypothetical protein